MTPAPQGVGDFVCLAKEVIEMTDNDDETGTTGTLKIRSPMRRKNNV